MDSLETDDKLTIVNRSTEYKISKKLIHKIPYFDKMLSHDLLESKSVKVEFDFDDEVLKSILDCVEFGIMFIDMKNALNFCNLIDYFGIDNNLLDDCLNYFHANFSIELLPTIIPQATHTSKWINASALNAFICRHFLKILNTKAWLDYPFETIEYICALDLMINSETQVYKAIKRWIEFKVHSRKCFIKRLFQLVRWCHLKDYELYQIKKDAFFANFGAIFWLFNGEDCNHIYNRTKQEYFIMIEELDGTDLRIKILDNDFLPLTDQVITLDKSISTDFFQDEHVSDIFFDFGKKRIRIDWSQNRYCFLDFSDNKSYYNKIYRYFFEKYDESEKPIIICNLPYGNSGSAILEAGEQLILVQNGPGVVDLYRSKSQNVKIDDYFNNHHHNFHITVLNRELCMLTHDHKFIHHDTSYGKHIALKTGFDYKNLIFTSKQSNDDRVIFINTDSSKDCFCYNIKTKSWSSIDLMIHNSSTGDQKDSNKLLTFTSAFLSINVIRQHMKQHFSP